MIGRRGLERGYGGLCGAHARCQRRQRCLECPDVGAQGPPEVRSQSVCCRSRWSRRGPRAHQPECRAAATRRGGIRTACRHERIGIDARGEFQSVRRRIPAYRAAAYLDAAREISRPGIQTLPSEARRAEIRAAGSARFHLSRRDGKVGIGQRETLAPRHDGQIPACRCGQIIRRRTRKLQMLHTRGGADSQTLHRCLVQHLIARGVHQRDAVRARAICRQRVAAGVLAYVYRLIAVVARGYLQITAIRGRAVAENRPLVIPSHRPLDSRRHRHARRRTLRAIARIPERQHTRHRVAGLADLVGQQAVSRSLSVGIRDAVARQRRRLSRRDLAPVQRGDVIRRENLARYGCNVPQGVDRDGRQHAPRRGGDCLVGSASRMGVLVGPFGYAIEFRQQRVGKIIGRQTLPRHLVNLVIPDRALRIRDMDRGIARVGRQRSPEGGDVRPQPVAQRGPESVVSPGGQLPVAVKSKQRPSAAARRVIRAASRDEIRRPQASRRSDGVYGRLLRGPGQRHASTEWMDVTCYPRKYAVNTRHGALQLRQIHRRSVGTAGDRLPQRAPLLGFSQYLDVNHAHCHASFSLSRADPSRRLREIPSGINIFAGIAGCM